MSILKTDPVRGQKRIQVPKPMVQENALRRNGKSVIAARQTHEEDIGSVAVFKKLPPTAINALRKQVKVREIRRGAVLFNQSDPIHTVYLLQAGAIRLVQYTPDGQAVNLAMFAPGDLFGLLEAVQSRPAMGSAEAMKDSVLCAFPGEMFNQLVHEHPALGATVTEHLTAYLFSGYERIRELSTLRVEARLANSVLRLVDQFGEETDERWQIDLPLSRQTLAELVGTRLETISRTMRGWEQQGMVECGRESITVLNLQAIREIASEH